MSNTTHQTNNEMILLKEVNAQALMLETNIMASVVKPLPEERQRAYNDAENEWLLQLANKAKKGGFMGPLASKQLMDKIEGMLSSASNN